MKKIIVFISLFLALSAPTGLLAQIAESADLATITFVKDSIELNPEKLYFNVIKIKNNTNATLPVTLVVTLPQEWKTMTTVPSTLEIAAGKTKPVPLRINIPKTTPAGKPYTISAEVYNASNTLIDKAITHCIMEVNRNWTMDIDEPSVYFQPESVQAPFSFSIENKGNVEENYKLTYKESEELKLPTGAKKPPEKLTVAPQSDTTLNLLVNCNRYFLITPFSDAMLSVSAATDMDLKEKNIRFIRLPGEYDNLSNAKILPLNIIGTKTRMYNTLSVPITTTFFRGRIPVKKDQFMVYRLYSRNIFDINDFWSDNDIELYYSTKHFEGGFGSSGSFLGKNLYVRNSFYGDLEQRLGDYNNIYLFANKSLLEKSYSVAAGHELTTQVFSMMNSGAYSDNSLVDARTRSLRNVSSLTFAPRNTVSYQGLYYETMANSENSIDAINYEHKVNYRGRISDVVTLNAYNEYRLLDTEIREQYSNTARGSAGVRLGKKGFMVSGIYANSKKEQLQKSDGSSDYEIVSEQATAQLSLPSIRKTRIITGVTYKNLTQDASGNNVWQSDEYNYFLKANSYGTRMQYRAEVTIGIRDALHSGYVLDRAFHKSATATLKRKLGLSGEYSLNLNYSDGVITGTNWGQSLEEKFSASAAYKQYLYKKMLALNVTGAYDHSTLRSDAMVLNTALEGTLKNNLELILKSSFRSNTDAILSFTSIEATISKGFDINRKKANYYDFVVVCFKDLNGNGKYDSREPGIENIQVSLQLLQEDESFTKAGQAVKFKNAALLSGKSGTVTCTYMPAGEYELQLLPLSDLKGFFNFSGSAQQINLNKNTKHYVPYIQAARIYGMIDIQKSNFSQTGIIDIANIRVTATDDQGNTFTVLTDKMGYYTLYVPKNRNYKVSINNIMGSKFQLEQNNIPVSMKDKAKESVNFIFKEKKRKINFSRG